MKRKLASAVVVFGLLASSTTPANAIFGLSNCEKVVKKIKSENLIGYELFSDFDEVRDRYIPYGYLSVNQSKELSGLAIYVQDSAINTYIVATKNPNCFNAKQNARNRKELGAANQFKTTLQTIINSFTQKPQAASELNKITFNLFNAAMQTPYSFDFTK